MGNLSIQDVVQYVEENIPGFHAKKLQSLESIKLSKILRRKNPYLFKAKNVGTSEAIVRSIVDAHISSSEETIFGDWLEGLAIFVNAKIYNGRKSGIPGIDLEFDLEDKRYIVSIKSGPNWGNARQISKMKSDFISAQKTLRTSNSKLTIIAVNGCCYGTDQNEDKGGYLKLCGQRFWEFISGNPNFYTEIIQPIGYKAQEFNLQYGESYNKMINKLTIEFSTSFCNQMGEIEWEKLVKFNSGKI